MLVDRETGEVLVAVLFNAQNWSFGIGLKTGMPKVSPDIQPGGDVKLERGYSIGGAHLDSARPRIAPVCRAVRTPR